MEPTGPSQTNNIQSLLSALNLFNGKNKQVRNIVSMALINTISNALALDNLTVPISPGLISASKGPDSQIQLPSTSAITPNDTIQRTWISLFLTGAGVTKNTLIYCSTTSEFLSKLHTIPKTMVAAMITKGPQTMLYFQMLNSFRAVADGMGIPPNIGIPAATALACTFLNPPSTAQMEITKQLSNGSPFAKIPNHLMEDFLKNPKRYVTAGLTPTIVRSAALEMVIEASQNHLGLTKENAIQLSYCVAFPLAIGADLSRMGLPVSIKTMRSPPVALGTAGMAAAIVVTPQAVASIAALVKNLTNQT